MAFLLTYKNFQEYYIFVANVLLQISQAVSKSLLFRHSDFLGFHSEFWVNLLYYVNFFGLQPAWIMYKDDQLECCRLQAVDSLLMFSFECVWVSKCVTARKTSLGRASEREIWQNFTSPLCWKEHNSHSASRANWEIFLENIYLTTCANYVWKIFTTFRKRNNVRKAKLSHSTICTLLHFTFQKG